MRIAGKFKKAEIRVLEMYITQTYGRYLLLRDLEKINRRIVNEQVYVKAADLFGLSIPKCIAGYDDIDYKELLPPETIYSRLWCHASIKGEMGSNLVLIWFQDHSQDPFTCLAEKLEAIRWEAIAEDSEYFQ